jgi:hypothetical protein
LNVDVERVHAMLEGQVRKGRTAVEATGEIRWVVGLNRDSRITSNQIRDETIQVIDHWLATQMSVPLEELGPFTLVAEEYARFLAEHVNIDVPVDPITVTENAWRDWRKKTGGG